jgi:Phage tail lysozyme
LSAGIWHGGSKFGLFRRASQHGPEHEVGGVAEPCTGRLTGPRRTTARKRVGMVVPAAVAATLAVGAAAYGLSGSGSPQAAQLSDVVQPASLSSAGNVGVGTAGSAETAASAMIRVAKTASGSVARPSARPQATRSPQAAAKPQAASKPQAAAKSPATPATAGTTKTVTAAPVAAAAAPTTAAPIAAAAAPIAAPSSAATATTLSCNLSSALLPQNVTTIVSFLLDNGYSDNAAAGIAGNMYQESDGNPESEGMGGGGLIGFTPLPGNYVTGDPAADLQTQLSAVLTFNQQWASYLPELNAAATPADAADIYVSDFERAGIPAASNREAAAEAVAEACGI